MEPSGRKTGPIDIISYTMIVSGLLNPFLAILHFFDSYHNLATLSQWLILMVDPMLFDLIVVRFDQNWSKS